MGGQGFNQAVLLCIMLSFLSVVGATLIQLHTPDLSHKDGGKDLESPEAKHFS